jgi:hypothetical protein
VPSNDDFAGWHILYAATVGTYGGSWRLWKTVAELFSRWPLPVIRLALAIPIFTKLANAQQQHYLQISYTELRPNRTINVEISNRPSVTPLNEI